jgi:hypothetical protein
MKNLCIITSVINTSSNPLSYSSTRSIYNETERFDQTKLTIDSVRSYIKNCEILFIESSQISSNYENDIEKMVDHYFRTGEGIRSKIDGPHKASGEASQIREGLKFINISNYDHIFKISGRYRINQNFILDDYMIEDNVFLETEDGQKLATVFYKIFNKEFYLKALDACSESSDMLELNFKNIFGHDFKKVKMLGVEGNVSVDGNFINW